MQRRLLRWPLRPRALLAATACALAALLLLFLLLGRTDQPVRIVAANGSLDPMGPTTHAQLRPADKPIILYWTVYFDSNLRTTMFNDSEPCPYECEHSSDRGLGAKAAVRVFHLPHAMSGDLPPPNPDAYNVFYVMESPKVSINVLNHEISPSYFNASGTYSARSDIYYPYNFFEKIDGSETPDQVYTDKQVDDAIDAKTQMGLVAISNCGFQSSSRLQYLDELGKHMNITRVGRCGATVQTDCDRQCLKEHMKTHRFILAFENAVCPEYTTEKFWRLKRLIVPVVLSRASLPLGIPNGTFISASDFATPQALADYLGALANDKVAYKRFFEWTRTLRIPNNHHRTRGACQLCRLAHQRRRMQIPDFARFWSAERCIDGFGALLLRDRARALRLESEAVRFTRQNTAPRLPNVID